MSQAYVAPPLSVTRRQALNLLSRRQYSSHNCLNTFQTAVSAYKCGELPPVPLLPVSPSSSRRNTPQTSPVRRARSHVSAHQPSTTTTATTPRRRICRLHNAENEDISNICENLNRVLQFDENERRSHLKGAQQWLLPGSFASIRESVVTRLFNYFNNNVLNSTLSGTTTDGTPLVSLSWSVRLYKTAGITKMKRRAASGERIAAIELSTKVVDCPDRLYNTLAHEICHAATWIIDDCAKPPHGATFKKWAAVFRKWDPNLQITTCHDYDISYKFNYVCNACGQSYGRHSRSINVKKQVCGVCKGELSLQKRTAPQR